MRTLKITKEHYNKSRYFQNKYGKLKYVNESGDLYKTNKGNLIKFVEAKKKSDFDGAPNVLDELIRKLDSATEDLEYVQKLREKLARFTLEAIQKRKEAKAAMSAARSLDKETKFLDDDAKEFAEYLGLQDGGSMFFAVMDHLKKTGVLVTKKAKVASQDDSYDKILEKITDPDIVNAYPQLKEVGESVKKMLESAMNMLIEYGIFNQPKKDTTSAASIYDQDEEGKMHKFEEGVGDMIKGAWNKIKDGFSKFINWFTQKFFPKYQVTEENYLQRLDDYLTKIDNALA